MTRNSNVAVISSDEFAAAQYHLSLAAEHSKRANDHLTRYYQSLPGSGITAGDLKLGNRTGPRCVKVWTSWLAENGPAYRQDITDATDMKFTERGTPYTIEWEDRMEHFSDDHFSADTICRIRGIREDGGRGGAPVLYFLWSQRFDIYGEFGVGPISRPPTDTDTVLGVVHPPTEAECLIPSIDPEAFAAARGEIEPRSDVTDGTVEENEPRSDSPDGTEGQSQPRFPSMDEWHERWDPLLEALSPHEVKPSDEERDEMVATLPEGTADPLAVVAVEYNAARRRVQDRS